MYRNFKQIVPPPRWGRLGGGEGKSSSPSPCPSHQGRGIFMYRNFKVCIMATKQPPESPFSKGDLRKSPLIKGARGLCFFADIAMHLKVAAKGSLIQRVLQHLFPGHAISLFFFSIRDAIFTLCTSLFVSSFVLRIF